MAASFYKKGGSQRLIVSGGVCHEVNGEKIPEYRIMRKALLIIGVQCLLHLNIRLFQPKKYYSIKINFFKRGNANEKIKKIFSVSRFNHLIMRRRDGEVTISATLFTDKEFSSQKLSEILDENDLIISVERCDNE